METLRKADQVAQSIEGQKERETEETQPGEIFLSAFYVHSVTGCGCGRKAVENVRALQLLNTAQDWRD